MAVNSTTILNQVIATLTPSSSGGVLSYGTLGDPRFATQQIYDAMNSVDGRIVALICGNPLHGRRQLYLTSTANVANGSQLASRIGPIESVQFAISGGPFGGQTLTAKEMAPEQKDLIDQDNQNPNSLTQIRPRYAVEGDTLYHNAAALLKGGASGITVPVVYASYVRSLASPPALQSPDEYYDAVLAGTLALLFDVEGENPQSAARFQQMYQLMELAITTGQPTIPQFRLVEQIKGAAGQMEQQ